MAVSETFRALSSRNYRLFFIGQTLSLIGTWMESVAMGWFVYRLTGSEVLLGTVALAETGTGTPAAGQFRVVDVTTVTFRPPDGLPPGRYGVRIRSNGVESAVAWWVSVP